MRHSLKPILTLFFLLLLSRRSNAADFTFRNGLAQLVIGSDAAVRSLTLTGSDKSLLQTATLPFAAVTKNGQLFPATAATITDAGTVHTEFGVSGVTAEFRFTSPPNYFVVELVSLTGEGVEEVQLMQLDAPLQNGGGILAVRWDSQAAVCLMSLSQNVNSLLFGRGLRSLVYSGFGVTGGKVAILVSPEPRFKDLIRQVEEANHLPSPHLGGVWAKASPDVRTSYLFTDLTEKNADETIRYALEGGFRYILVYTGTWSASRGSYPINLNNFPGGEDSLKAVIAKCHAAGLKVGMHMMTSLIAKTDPIVARTPLPALLEDAQARLAADLPPAADVFSSAAALTGFPPNGVASYGPANDVRIEDEILHCAGISGSKLTGCLRGYSKTKPAAHPAGAAIRHLVDYDGSYVADLRGPLATEIADRISGLINRCGFDMIYFDAGEINARNGPAWYWNGVHQQQIWQRSQRDLLAQGSGVNQWTWHIFSRLASDDFSAVAVRQYLDYHKIADAWKGYFLNFMPAELGWTGFLRDAPDRPATTPDEVEYYAVRMAALDSPVSLETTLDALHANGRTDEMLRLLGRYETLRLSGAIPKPVRGTLETGEWHMTSPGEFHPIRYDSHNLSLPGELTFRNDFPAQPLKFRLQSVPVPATLGAPSNLTLFSAEAQPFTAPPPNFGPNSAPMPGALIRRVVLPKPVDLERHRALAIDLAVDLDVALPQNLTETPVLNVQLETADGFYRDYYIDLNFAGPRSVILNEPGTSRTLAEFRPAPAAYSFKSAMYWFNYRNVVAVNFRWMRYPRAASFVCRISKVTALDERPGSIAGAELSLGGKTLTIPAELKDGDYAEYWADGSLRTFDRNGNSLSTTPLAGGLTLAAGDNKLTLQTQGAASANARLTLITLGN